MVYKKSAKIHFVKYGVIKTVLYCLMSEVKMETRCSYETTHDAQGGESASGSTHTGHPPQTDCSHVQGTWDISFILTKQRLNKLGTHWAFILKIFRLTVVILKFYQIHLNWILSLLEKRGEKKTLDDMLFLVWKERTSPWRLGIYNYTITR